MPMLMAIGGSIRIRMPLRRAWMKRWPEPAARPFPPSPGDGGLRITEGAVLRVSQCGQQERAEQDD